MVTSSATEPPPWVAALRRTVRHYAPLEYRWGEVDCCQFVAHYWYLLTGHDYARRFRYADDRAGAVLLREHGGLLGVVQRCLGPPAEGPPQPGALVVMGQGSATLIGIYNGCYVTGITKDQGCARWRLDNVEGCWHAAGNSRMGC